MKVLCKKNNKYFKKDRWYNAILQDLNLEKPRGTFKIETEYSNFEIRKAYLVNITNDDCGIFYMEKSKYSKLEENIFSNYFYTEQEYRKLKLIKLNKL